jgi:hypothetical protein
MTIVERKIVEVSANSVCYARLDEPTLVIYRSVNEHKRALGKEPKVGDIVKFKMWTDYDGSTNAYLEGQ